MKKINLMFAGIMLSAVLLTACSSEEKAVQENAKTVEFNKSAEMLNFESSLREWMQAKRETASGQATDKQAESNIARDSQALLTSIGISPSETEKSGTSTEMLVHFTMRAYSKKLTEIYQQQMK
jgi:outer membrane murein-binding lipoprotein Lpp